MSFQLSNFQMPFFFNCRVDSFFLIYLSNRWAVNFCILKFWIQTFEILPALKTSSWTKKEDNTLLVATSRHRQLTQWARVMSVFPSSFSPFAICEEDRKDGWIYSNTTNNDGDDVEDDGRSCFESAAPDNDSCVNHHRQRAETREIRIHRRLSSVKPGEERKQQWVQGRVYPIFRRGGRKGYT